MVVREVINYIENNLKPKLKRGDFFYYSKENSEFKYLYISDNEIYYLGMRGSGGFNSNYNKGDLAMLTKWIHNKRFYLKPKRIW